MGASPRTIRGIGVALCASAAIGAAWPASGGILSGFKNSLISFALDQISVPDTLEIQAETIEDPEEGFVRLGGVTIADKQGVWMTIDELVVDWNVSRILRAELEISSLRATDIDVLRPPNPEDVEVEVKEGSELDRSLGGIFDWPRSPIDTRIDELALNDVFIAEGVMTEQSIRFDATGSARDEGPEQSVSLEVQRTDEIDGLIDLDYLRDFDANTLRLSLEAREDPGGLVAALFGLPNDAASRMVIDADGPLSEWRLNFQAETTDHFEARGEALLSTDQPFTARAEFSLDPGPEMGERYRRLLTPQATLTVAIQEGDDGVIRIEQAEISSPEINLTAEGAYNQRTNEVDVDVDLAVEEGLAESIEGVSLGRFTFDGNVEGTTDDLTATGALNLNRFATDRVEVDEATLEATVNVAGARVGAQLDGRISGVRLDRLTREQVGTAEISGGIVFENEIVRLDEFSIDSPLLEVGATGTVDLAQDRADLSYTLSSDQLAEIATTYDVDASGTLDVNGQVTGALAAPQLVGNARLTEVIYNGERYGQVTLGHDVSLGEEPQGQIDLSATGSPYGPASIETTFRLTPENVLRLTQMTAQALGITAEGRASVDLNQTLVTGDLSIDATNLSELGDYLDRPISGGAEGQVDLTVENGEQNVDARLSLNGLSFSGFGVGGGSLVVDLNDAMGTPALVATLDLENATGAGFEVGGIEGTVDLPEGEGVADVALRLTSVEGAGVAIPSATVEGTVTDPFGQPSVDLDLTVDEVEGVVSANQIEGTIESAAGFAEVQINIAASQLAAAGAEAERAVIDAEVTGIDQPGAMRIATDLALDGLSYQGDSLGRFEGRIATTEALEEVEIDARLIGSDSADGLQVGTATFDGVIRDPLNRPEADANILVEDFVYRDQRIGRLEGRIEMPEEEESVIVDLTVEDFALMGAAGSRAVLDGRIREPFAELPKPDLDLTIEDLSYDGVAMGTLSGTVDASETGDDIAFDLSLTGVERDGLTVDAAQVSGTVSDPLGQPAVTADLDVRDLAFRDYRLDELTGQVRTTPERDLITADLTLTDLDAPDFRIDSTVIDAAVADPFGQAKPTGTLVAEGLVYKGEQVGTLRATVQTVEEGEAPPEIEIDVALDGPAAERAVVDATIRDPYGQPLVDADIDIQSLDIGDLAQVERLDGQIVTSGDAEAVEIDLEAAGIDALGLRVQTATVDGTVSDPFGAPSINATIQGQDIAYGEEVRLGSVDATLTSLEGLDRIDVKASATDFSGFGASFNQARVDGILGDPLGEVSFQGEIAADALAYQDQLEIARIAGTIDARPGLEEIGIDAGFRNLNGYGVSIGAGQIDGTLTDPTGEIGFDGDIGIESLTYGDAAAVGRLSGTVDAAPGLGRVDLDLNFADIEAYGARITSGDIEGVLTEPTGDIRFDGRAVARQIRYGDYRIERIAAETDVTEGGDRIEATATLSNLSGGGARVGTADLKAVVENALTDPVIRADLDARNAGFQGNDAGRLQAQATITNVATAPRVQGTATAAGLSAGGARVGALDLRYDLNDIAGAPTGTINGRASNIAVGGINAARADLSARLTAPGGRTRIAADLDLTSVDLGPGVVERVEVDATVDNALGRTPVLNVAAAASPVDLGFARLGQTVVRASGPLSALDVTVATTGERVLYGLETEPLSFRAAGRFNLTGALSGQLSAAAFQIGDDGVLLTQPLTIRSVGGATRLSGIMLAIPGGTVTGDLAIYGSGIAGQTTVRLIDPGALARLAGLSEATGTVVIGAEFDTRPGRANAVIALDGAGLSFDDAEAGFGAFATDLDIAWDGRRAESTLVITGGFGEPVRARLALPLLATGGLVPTVPPDAQIDGRLEWQGDIGAFWPLVPLVDHVVDGPVAIDLAVSGPISGPQVSGTLAMNGGRYENLEFGTILTDVNISTDLQAADTFTLNLSASDGAGATVSGQARIGPQGIDARISADDAILVRRDDVTAALSTDLLIRGPLNAFDITGEATIDRAEVRLINLTPPSVQTLGDVRIKGRPAPRPAEAAAGRIGLGISVRAADDIFVRGRGLDSEWEAELDVNGSVASPTITGTIQRIRGELDLLGREFDLEEGLIDFDGRDPINPRIEVRLTRETDNIAGGIYISGTARDPEIEFFSRPSLPEEEVLPRVLFGRSKQSLSPLEAVQLGAGVARLLDGSGGALSSIRESLGVDVLRVESDGEETAVTVGRNVAEDVFVGVKQPIGEGSASVAVEIEVFENVDVKSEVGGDKGSSVGLQWKKDF